MSTGRDTASVGMYHIAHLWLKLPSHVQGSHSSDQGRVRGVPYLYFAFPLFCRHLLPLSLAAPIATAAAVPNCWPLVSTFWSVPLTRL